MRRALSLCAAFLVWARSYSDRCGGVDGLDIVT